MAIYKIKSAQIDLSKTFNFSRNYTLDGSEVCGDVIIIQEFKQPITVHRFEAIINSALRFAGTPFIDGTTLGWQVSYLWDERGSVITFNYTVEWTTTSLHD